MGHKFVSKTGRHNIIMPSAKRKPSSNRITVSKKRLTEVSQKVNRQITPPENYDSLEEEENDTGDKGACRTG